MTKRKTGDARKRKTYEPGDPYAEGWEAAEAGRDEQANSYPEGTREHAAWLQGFRSAGIEE